MLAAEGVGGVDVSVFSSSITCAYPYTLSERLILRMIFLLLVFGLV